MSKARKNGILGFLIVAAATLFAVLPVSAEDPGKGPESVAGQKAAASVGDAYPLSTCPVSDEPLGGMGKPVVLVHDGREVRLCCNGCQKDFDADPDKFLQKIDSQIIEQQSAAYPLDMCPISGEKLGGMGDPVKVVIGNRLVELCCGGCVKKAKADPAATIKKLDEAVIAKEKAGYAKKACIISGEPLGEGMGVDFVHANHLIRFCCKDCVNTFKEDPARYMAETTGGAGEKGAGGPQLKVDDKENIAPIKPAKGIDEVPKKKG